MVVDLYEDRFDRGREEVATVSKAPYKCVLVGSQCIGRLGPLGGSCLCM